MVNAVLSNAVKKPTRDICALETVVGFPHIQILDFIIRLLAPRQRQISSSL